MKLFINILFTFFILLPSLLLANTTPNFVEGDDYRVITPTGQQANLAPSDTITVYEFFNVACPACYVAEPAMLTWKKTKPQDVELERISVPIFKEWEVYVKAHLAARLLNKEDEITAALFKDIHEKKKRKHDEKDIKAIFIKAGVSEADFDSIYRFSPGLSKQIADSKQLTRDLRVLATPTLVVGNRYATDLSSAKGPDRMVQVLNYLIDKVRNEKNTDSNKTE